MSEVREEAGRKKEVREKSENAITDSEGVASTETLNRTVRLVSNVFGLDESYRVEGFADKGNTVKVSMGNNEYSIVVTVNNKSAHGLDAM